MAIETVNRKIARFVRPVVTGRDATRDVHLRPGDVPPLPEDLSTLRAYRVGAARVGLAS